MSKKAYSTLREPIDFSELRNKFPLITRNFEYCPAKGRISIVYRDVEIVRTQGMGPKQVEHGYSVEGFVRGISPGGSLLGGMTLADRNGSSLVIDLWYVPLNDIVSYELLDFRLSRERLPSVDSLIRDEQREIAMLRLARVTDSVIPVREFRVPVALDKSNVYEVIQNL